MVQSAERVRFHERVTDSLSQDPITARREHPAAFWLLLLAMLTPAVIGVTALSLLLKRLFPAPSQLLIFGGAAVLILVIAPLMLLGAFGWLLVARRFVPRQVVRPWFIYPGYGILWRVSKWMFICVYGKDDASKPSSSGTTVGT